MNHSTPLPNPNNRPGFQPGPQFVKNCLFMSTFILCSLNYLLYPLPPKTVDKLQEKAGSSPCLAELCPPGHLDTDCLSICCTPQVVLSFFATAYTKHRPLFFSVYKTIKNEVHKNSGRVGDGKCKCSGGSSGNFGRHLKN